MPKNKNRKRFIKPAKSKKAATKTIKSEKENAGSASKKDNIARALGLAPEINEFHAKAQNNEIEAVRNGWEAGTRLNQAFEHIEHGDWNKYLKDNCPSISRTTAWRYRQMAKCFTVKQLENLTLSDAYEKMHWAKIKQESFSASKNAQPSEKKAVTSDARMIEVLAKTAKYFDDPEKMAGPEKDSLKRVLVRLVEVFNKLDGAVFTWNEEESELITALYEKVRIQKVEV